MTAREEWPSTLTNRWDRIELCRSSDRDTSKSHATALRYRTDHFFYRQAVIHGEPCTIFLDKNVRMFCIAPVFYKQELMERPGRYEHIVDLDWLPGAAPTATTSTAGTAGTAGSAGTAGTATSSGTTVRRGPVKEEADAITPTAGTNAAAGTTARRVPVKEEADAITPTAGINAATGITARRGPVKKEAYPLIPKKIIVDEQGPATTGSPQSIERVRRPPKSWAFSMREEPKGMPEDKSGISFADLSNEAARQWKTLSYEAKARQWKALSDEAKAFYQELAKEADLQHSMK